MTFQIRNGYVGDWRLDDVSFLTQFKEPGPAERCCELQIKNKFDNREDRVVFFPESHIYEIDGLRVPRSVTSLIYSYSSRNFNPHEAVRTMRKGRHWQNKRQNYLRHDGSEMEDAEIIEHWKFNGKVASARGTLFHYNLCNVKLFMVCESELN